MGECVQVRLLKQGDLSDIVSIHMHAFEGFFLTTLGNSFLKTYYKSVLKTKDSILAGAYIDQKLVGPWEMVMAAISAITAVKDSTSMEP